MHLPFYLFTDILNELDLSATARPMKNPYES